MAQSAEDPRREPLSHAREHGGGERERRQAPKPQRWSESVDANDVDDWDVEMTQELGELRECDERLGLSGSPQPSGCVQAPEAPREAAELADELVAHGEQLGTAGRGLAPLD